MRSIEKYQTALSILKQLYIDEISISNQSESLSTILKDHKQLIIAMNHGPMMGALAGLIGLAEAMSQNGGRKRTPFGITWRNFYKYPITKQVLTFLTQINHGVGFDEAMGLLEDGDFSDCVIMPEGELCNFGNGHTIQAFLSPRFIELAILNDIPILIAIHQGSEEWAWPIDIDSRLLPLFHWLPLHMRESLHRTKTISVPKLFKPKLNNLRMSFCLYQPNLSKTSLSEDKSIRHSQLLREANWVRQKMQSMMRQLRYEKNIEALVTTTSATSTTSSTANN